MGWSSASDTGRVTAHSGHPRLCLQTEISFLVLLQLAWIVGGGVVPKPQCKFIIIMVVMALLVTRRSIGLLNLVEASVCFNYRKWGRGSWGPGGQQKSHL